MNTTTKRQVLATLIKTSRYDLAVVLAAKSPDQMIGLMQKTANEIAKLTKKPGTQQEAWALVAKYIGQLAGLYVAVDPEFKDGAKALAQIAAQIKAKRKDKAPLEIKDVPVLNKLRNETKKQAKDLRDPILLERWKTVNWLFRLIGYVVKSIDPRAPEAQQLLDWATRIEHPHGRDIIYRKTSTKELQETEKRYQEQMKLEDAQERERRKTRR
jgi:hypothetical protein